MIYNCITKMYLKMFLVLGLILSDDNKTLIISICSSSTAEKKAV